jgi:hypothetical protein
MKRSYRVAVIIRALVGFALIPAALAAQSNPRITVSKNVQVSRDMPNVFHYETLIAVDPANSARLIACSMHHNPNGRFGHRTIVYVSSDSGATWSRALIDSVSVGLRSDSYDPDCTFGVDGAMHFTRLSPLAMYTSKDDGRTWDLTRLPAGEMGKATQDRDFIVVDHTGGKYHGRVYAYAQQSGEQLDQGFIPPGIALWYSKDGGKTFSQPVMRFPVNKTQGWGMHPANAVVLSDGTWVAAFNELQTLAGTKGTTMGKDAFIKIITSTDGGESLNPAVTVANPYNASASGQTMPMIAADTRTALFKDRLYVVYLDRIGDRPQLVVSYSSDKGKTWSSPRLVSDGTSWAQGPESLFGRFFVAVNQSGVVGVVWEDRRDSTMNGKGRHVRFAASLDGGDTWSPSVRVSDVPTVSEATEKWYASVSDKPWESKTAFEVARFNDGGHTIGMATDASGAFHLIWSDGRTGISQLWTATVRVPGTPMKFGDANLAQLSDLSSKVKIEVIGSSFDQATNRITVRTRLRNLSNDTLAGALKVRALLMISEATTSGTAAALGTENRVTGPGAIWDFSSLTPAGALLPNAFTQERTLVFELQSPRPIGGGKKFRYDLPIPGRMLRFEGQVLGSGKKTDAVRP